VGFPAPTYVNQPISQEERSRNEKTRPYVGKGTCCNSELLCCEYR